MMQNAMTDGMEWKGFFFCLMDESQRLGCVRGCFHQILLLLLSLSSSFTVMGRTLSLGLLPRHKMEDLALYTIPGLRWQVYASETGR